MVPEDSSAARMPRPGATMASATLLSSARFMVSSIYWAGAGPSWRRFLAGVPAARLLCGVAAHTKLGIKITAGVAARHGRHWNRLDFRCLAGRPELFVALPAQFGHRLHRRLEILARVELAGILLQDAADFSGHRHPVVGVDVDLANAMTDAALDLLDRHAPGLRHLAAVAVDDVLQLLRHRG